ncbi:MAG: FtsX-like permease family protein, partial [Rhodothermales bacterium]|nr:FtsX-like permease family protein [Rhodothermales bacterium]
SAAALALGLAVAEAFLPTFNRLTEKALSFGAAGPALWLALAATALGAGLVAGSYPALLLSGFRPVEILRGRVALGGSGALTRTLVAVQFGVSVFLIGSTFVMLSQLGYVRSAALGFDEEHVVVIPTQGLDGDRVLGRFRQALAGRPDVVGVTGANTSFARGSARRGFTHEGTLYQVGYFEVESDYPEVLGLDFVAGRGFDPARPADTTMAVVVNEAAVRAFGWETPVGQRLAGYTDDPVTDPRVIGVVEDYHYKSLVEEIEPLLLTLERGMGLRQVLVRIAPRDLPATLAHLEATWDAVAGGLPFAYSFLDEDLDGMYAEQERWSAIISYAAFFAVLIACLGLFGLAALAVAGRTKEIGIRKVLGATATRVTVLLSKDFAVLVLAGAALALPAAYFAMQAWLDSFAYHVELGPGPFLLALGLAAVTALATVGVHAVRAALADPVAALRTE